MESHPMSVRPHEVFVIESDYAQFHQRTVGFTLERHRQDLYEVILETKEKRVVQGCWTPLEVGAETYTGTSAEEALRRFLLMYWSKYFSAMSKEDFHKLVDEKVSAFHLETEQDRRADLFKVTKAQIRSRFAFEEREKRRRQLERQLASMKASIASIEHELRTT